MITKLGFIGACIAILVASSAAARNTRVKRNTKEAEFIAWHTAYNTDAQVELAKKVTADWTHDTDVTQAHEEAQVLAGNNLAKWQKEKSSDMRTKFKQVDVDTFADAKNKRLYSKISKLGDANLSAEKFDELSNAKTRMINTYATAKVCKDRTITDITKCAPADVMSLEPELTKVISESRDYNELLHAWKSWRDVSGKLMRADYGKYIDLKNEGAIPDGYANTAEAWRGPYVEPLENYSDKNFVDEINAIWIQLRPLYEQLHAYVRTKLVAKYGADKVNPHGPIPAHLLGNMWAQSWLNLLDFTVPHQGKPALDVTAQMVAQNWDARKMFDEADKFFVGLGLEKMPENFYRDSMIVKPAGKEVVCHASAWDFYNGQDFRVKQCTAVTMDDLFTVHHEMGHIEYFLQYKGLPVTFRDGANDGFHEAIGDTLTLSVSTPKHLSAIGLLKNYDPNDTDLDINFMFSTALEKIAFLPFGLAMDLYRYEVFSGAIGKDKLNEKWWDKLLEYQGVCAPLIRTEDDFDPGSKFHIPSDVPYMRYFVSFVIQFQFHKAMCDEAGHEGPLYKCDINESKEAGSLMAEALKLGSSEPWQFAMEKLTKQKKMDAGPLLEFFEPLYEFLAKENAKSGSLRGWTPDRYCPATGTPADTTPVGGGGGRNTTPTPKGSATTIWMSSVVITAVSLTAFLFGNL